MIHPIENIQWKKADSLKPNDYNPNVVYNTELKLLKLSLLTNGWIQPVLIDSEGIIIDGYHRWWLTQNHKEIAAIHNAEVPCAVMELTEVQRILLTIRINRAKGSHIAYRMHEAIRHLLVDLAADKKEVADGIGASIDEIDLLLQENIFQQLGTKDHKYSKAWVPGTKGAE